MALNLDQQTLFSIIESCWKVSHASTFLCEAGQNHGNEVHIMMMDNFDLDIIAKILLCGQKRGISLFSTFIGA